MERGGILESVVMWESQMTKRSPPSSLWQRKHHVLSRTRSRNGISRSRSRLEHARAANGDRNELPVPDLKNRRHTFLWARQFKLPDDLTRVLIVGAKLCGRTCCPQKPDLLR